ncbi:MAG: chromosomal replication initiator protein DnaA [Clostridia bacterium]|jgi:chromosomal replication initiator protein|nr:chromosomal replication initiator protein DnaA [Clostridia bacterium]MBQ5802063.1 chromosomal replication initiator protein DnaA [Clostridia bacterium]
MEQYELIWEAAKKRLEKTMPVISYGTWIAPLTAININNDKLVLHTTNRLSANMLNRYVDSIRNAIIEEMPQLTGFELFVADKEEDFLAEKSQAAEGAKPMELNPKYTFDRFVVGSSNKFVHAAAQAVAENPGFAYNPLFIYGGTGLGKTHVMHAIGNHIKKTKPELRVIYVTGESFTNELIESIKSGRKNGVDFRLKYRNVDVFIIDDIQFIANKQSTQEEFFHTFNELHNQNKQIILSSDRHPSEIALLEDRLRTRFEGGLIADVQPPDIETKIAILKKKAAEEKKILDNSVLELIAGDSISDIRTLEGRLKSVLFLAALENRPITPEFAKEALRFSKETSREVMTTDTVIDAVCDYFKLTKENLLGKKRNKELVEPRQICIYLITELINLPLVAIGQAMGGRDHTTVIHARDKIAEQIKTSDRLATQISDLKNLILKK